MTGRRVREYEEKERNKKESQMAEVRLHTEVRSIELLRVRKKKK